MFKIMVMADDNARQVDVIEYDDRAWLVPAWTLSSDGQRRRPLRAIGLGFAPGYGPVKFGAQHLAEFFQGTPIPASLLERGEIPPGKERLFEVRENPDIWLPNPERSH